MFRHKGFNGTGVAEIAARVGITNAALYYHFKSKQEMLFVILERTMRQHLDVLEEIVASEDPAAQQLQRALDNHLDFIFERPDAVRVFLRERRFLEGKYAEEYQTLVKRYDELFDHVIVQYMGSEGPAKSSSARLLRFSALGMLNWITEWYRPDGDYSEGDLRREMISLVMDRLLAPETREGTARRASVAS